MADALGDYLNAIGRTPLLTTVQEIQLGRQIQAMRDLQATGRTDLTRSEQRVIRNGKRAIDRMMTSNLRLVVSVARRYHRVCQTLELIDVISLGNIGLATAAEKFEPQRGYKFSTYAYWWIRQGIMRGMMQEDRMIRIPVHQHENASKLRNLLHEHQARTGRDMPLEEAVEHVGCSLEDVRRVALAWTSCSLDLVTLDDGQTLMTAIHDPTQDPMDQLLVSDAEQKLPELMQHLGEIDQQVLQMRYGLGGGDQKTLSDIGRTMGVSRERIRQRHDCALRRMRLIAGVA
jgi:RNA polymerase sigma factor (sigma-70 family)